MKKKLGIFLCTFMLCLAWAIPVLADTGPKPSVVIDFEGVEGETYYVTLLAEDEFFGPYSFATEDDVPEGDEPENVAFRKFYEYEDADGYHFLQYMKECSETNQFEWGYYPPDKFKILVYFPAEDRLLTDGEVHSCYAFDSYYTVKINGDEMSVEKTDTSQMRMENYAKMGIKFLIRLLATLALEMGIATAFGFREKMQLGCIAIVNILTQIVLNYMIYWILSPMGSMAYILFYVPIEILILIFETVVYCLTLNRIGKEKKSIGRIVGYTILANVVSFVVGSVVALEIAALLPTEIYFWEL